MTAVEWLYEQFLDGRHHTDKEYKEIFEEAKGIEKQQIIEAHGDKKRTKSNTGSIVTYGYTYTGEMYYNEKFKK